MAALNADSATDIFKLHMSAASGNNSVLFDNAGGEDREIDIRQLAIDLVTFQNFSPGGTIGVVKWGGCPTAPKAPDSAVAAPCVASSAIHTFLMGENVINTLSLNLLPWTEICPAFKGKTGKPIWEMIPINKDDKEAIHNATETYLGRLVPVSRAVKIKPDLKTCLLAQGLPYIVNQNQSAIYWEGSMTVNRDNKGNSKVMGAHMDRALWRNLSALLYHNININLKPHYYDNDKLSDATYTLWLGAMVVDKAKICGLMDEMFVNLPSSRGYDFPRALKELLSCAGKGELFLANAIDAFKEGMGCKKATIKPRQKPYFGTIC